MNIELDNVRVGDTVHLNNAGFEVDGVSGGMARLRMAAGQYWLSLNTLREFGATATRLTPPRSLPDWRGAVIEASDGVRDAVLFEPGDSLPWRNDDGIWITDKEVIDYLGKDWRLVSRPVTDEMVETALDVLIGQPGVGMGTVGVRAMLEAVLGGGDGQ